MKSNMLGSGRECGARAVNTPAIIGRLVDVLIVKSDQGKSDKDNRKYEKK